MAIIIADKSLSGQSIFTFSIRYPHGSGPCQVWEESRPWERCSSLYCPFLPSGLLNNNIFWSRSNGWPLEPILREWVSEYSVKQRRLIEDKIDDHWLDWSGGWMVGRFGLVGTFSSVWPRARTDHEHSNHGHPFKQYFRPNWLRVSVCVDSSQVA